MSWVLDLVGGLVVHGPFVGLRTARGRLLVIGRGSDPEDVFAHPLLDACELVPAEADRAYPPAEVFALVHDVARLHGQFAAGFEVLSGEVEGALPFHGPGRAP
ncbi:hypothetical protein ACWEN3_13880 [Streptomyces sp. NPDC004561]